MRILKLGGEEVAARATMVDPSSERTRVFGFKAPRALIPVFERIVQDARQEGITQSEWVARAARTFWQAQHTKKQEPTLYVSPLAPKEWMELGAMLEDLRNAFAEGVQAQLDLGFYRTWAADPGHRLAKSFLLQEMAAEPSAKAFDEWWHETVDSRPAGLGRPPAGRSA